MGIILRLSLNCLRQHSKEQTLRYADYIAKSAEEAAKDFELDDDPLRGVFTSLGRTVAPATAAPSTDGGAASNKAYIELLLKDASHHRNFSTSDFEKVWREKVGEIPWCAEAYIYG